MSIPDLQSLFLELASLDDAQRESRLGEIQRENPTLSVNLRSLIESHDANPAPGLSTHDGASVDDFGRRDDYVPRTIGAIDLVRLRED